MGGARVAAGVPKLLDALIEPPLLKDLLRFGPRVSGEDALGGLAFLVVDERRLELLRAEGPAAAHSIEKPPPALSSRPIRELIQCEAPLGGFLGAGQEVLVIAVRHDGIQAGPQELVGRELGEGGYRRKGCVLAFRKRKKGEAKAFGPEVRGGERALRLIARIVSRDDGFGEKAVRVRFVLPEVEKLHHVLQVGLEAVAFSVARRRMKACRSGTRMVCGVHGWKLVDRAAG